MLDRLLIPLDGSEAAHVALTYAASIPSRSVRLLMVLFPEDELSSIALAGRKGAQLDEARVSAERYLSDAARVFEAQGRQVETATPFGGPAEQILKFGEDADLIIMTTHGYGAGRRMLFGSVADRIGRESQAPVLLIRGGDRPVHARPVQRIVVPLDGSDLAEAALPPAKELAATLGVPVVLVRVLDAEQIRQAAHLGSSPITAYAGSISVVRNAAEGYLEEHAQGLRDSSIATSIELREGSPAGELLELAQPGDLLVMTSHGRSGIRRWMLGSVADKLLHEAPCPVLLIRSLGAPAS